VLDTPGVPDRKRPADAEPAIQRDLIVIGASAGGVEALQRLVSGLPSNLPASVLIVLHMMPSGPSYLHGILNRATRLPVTRVRDGERLKRGHVYVAPPGFHTLLRKGSIQLSAGPPEKGHRPAIDLSFHSAARAYGPRAIGVVLTGTLTDGAEGLRLIKAHGGATVVQDPDDASFGDMPRNAIDRVDPDRIATLNELSGVLCDLIYATHSLDEEGATFQETGSPSSPGSAHVPPQENTLLLTCPACGGVLIERAGDGVRFACHAGHAYTPESLVEQQGAALESTLWQAMRTLEERAELLRRLAGRTPRPATLPAQSKLEERAAIAASHAGEIHETILRLRGTEGETATETSR
jgi:two-component system, chemotaxis family, protein-glutamate methylesterase/glutaminase